MLSLWASPADSGVRHSLSFLCNLLPISAALSTWSGPNYVCASYSPFNWFVQLARELLGSRGVTLSDQAAAQAPRLSEAGQ